ncbi:MAG: MaoC family dehydratase N-terminal domain-containing protein [Firmicutes bacterium]|nr:MaoC family dehydratase N-terminal domain-containing protein [Bacillota bacterium]
MDWRPGSELPPLTVGPITTEMLVRWAAAAEDYNPIHYDQAYARKQGLPDVVMHGPFKLALFCRLLHSQLGPRGYIRRIKVRYTGLDVPGDVLEFRGTVERVEEGEGERLAAVRLVAQNARGVVTVQGEAEVAVREQPADQAS